VTTHLFKKQWRHWNWA